MTFRPVSSRWRMMTLFPGTIIARVRIIISCCRVPSRSRRDSGIGLAVTIAYAREGADVLISYLNEHDDAKQTERLVKDAGRKAVLIAGDIQQPNHCRLKTALAKLGGIDILVNNAAHQASFKSIEDISDEEG